MGDIEPWTMPEMKIVNPPEHVCHFSVFGNDDLKFVLTEWPSRWRRFWFWVFFGWRFIEGGLER